MMDLAGAAAGALIGYALGVLLEDLPAAARRVARLTRDTWRMWRNGLST